MIETSEHGSMMITGEHIPFYRLMVIAQGIKGEIKGIRISRGRTCYAIAKSEFGFKGNRTKVLAQLEAHIEDVKKQLA